MKSCLKLSNGTFETRREAVSKMHTAKAALAKQSLECKSGGIRLFFPSEMSLPCVSASTASPEIDGQGEAPEISSTGGTNRCYAVAQPLFNAKEWSSTKDEAVGRAGS